MWRIFGDWTLPVQVYYSDGAARSVATSACHASSAIPYLDKHSAAKLAQCTMIVIVLPLFTDKLVMVRESRAQTLAAHWFADKREKLEGPQKLNAQLLITILERAFCCMPVMRETLRLDRARDDGSDTS